MALRRARTPRTAASPHPAGRAAPACAGRRSRCHRRAQLAVRHPPAHWPPTRRRPTGWLAADGSLPAAWLLAQWPPQAAEPTDYSLADLPETTPLPELVRQRRVRALNAEVPAGAWARRSAGAGAHGLRLYDWARIELLAGFDPGWARWVLARRSIPTDGEQAELAFYVCAGPAETSLE